MAPTLESCLLARHPVSSSLFMGRDFQATVADGQWCIKVYELLVLVVALWAQLSQMEWLLPVG